MVFVHTTGIYSRKVEWCQCENHKSHYAQLLQARLFPATSDRPSTAFTFEVLDELHLQRIECKTVSSNFYSLLRRKTDFNAPLDVPVCFVRVFGWTSPISILGPLKRDRAHFTVLP